MIENRGKGMNYNKYLFDWKNQLLEESEYTDTDKYAFSLLNKAQEMLTDHIANYDMTSEQKKSLRDINNLLKEVYLETSHIERKFLDDFS